MKTLLKLVGLSIVGLVLAGCETSPDMHKSQWTNQPIEKADELKLGMTEEEVIALLGRPIFREFQGNESILQWCKSGIEQTTPYDRFLVVYFTNDSLVGTKNYSNKDEPQYGDCKTLYREVDWTDKPNQIIEVRDRKVNY